MVVSALRALASSLSLYEYWVLELPPPLLESTQTVSREGWIVITIDGLTDYDYFLIFI